jgi:hypothetical protein
MRTLDISVSRKILADISSGIYRTPANALKEIVSNAFDAGANKVHITTNAPYFDVFTCEDDGEGMSAEEFAHIMRRIGSSNKRATTIERQNNGRPIIGKIGIGLLSVAQICNKFTVISKKEGSASYFEATIDLRQFDDIEKEKGYKKGEGNISLGKYQIEDDLIDEIGAERHYTKIIMEDLKEGFYKKLREKESKSEFKIIQKAEESKSFIDFTESIRTQKFNEISQYDQLIYELGILCPVKYIEKGCLPNNKHIKKQINRLGRYKFELYVDGYEIRKPIIFPTDKDLVDEDEDFKLYPPFSFKGTIDNSEFSFTGYVFHQRTRILPAELQGILIRIKDVAIGNYDRTFLHYPKAEGPMFSQLTGEIFVEKGLEEALNIDRNSFNEAHSHYLRLQQELRDYLGGEDGVFKDIRKRSKLRQDRVHGQESKVELKVIGRQINKILGINIRLRRLKSKNDKPYIYEKKNKTLKFYSNPFWAKSRKERLVQEKIILAITAAESVSTSINTFKENLSRVFAYRGK